MQTNALKVISLFSGCGGLDLGFHKAGFNIVYANDIAPDVKQTYEYNLGPIEIEDIRKIDKVALPDCDVILAGIPCQAFSLAGNRLSIADKDGSLFEQVIEILTIKQPGVVLFENVRGFLSSKDEYNVPMVERLSKDLDRVGYKLYWQLINASDYAVPQNRYRVIMVGIKKALNKTFTFPDVIIDKSGLSVGCIIKRPLPMGEKEELMPFNPQSRSVIRHIPEGGCIRDVPYGYLPMRFKRMRMDRDKYNTMYFYRRYARDEIVGTITASATPEKSGITHSYENRRYSVREVARFQSFPDDFIFLGDSIRKKYKMIGNAVPVNLSYHLAKKIKEDIFD